MHNDKIELPKNLQAQILTIRRAQAELNNRLQDLLTGYMHGKDLDVGAGWQLTPDASALELAEKENGEAVSPSFENASAP